MNALVPIRPTVLDGEILGPDQSVEVIVALNIFSERKERIRVSVGSTIEEIVAIAEAGYVGPRPPSLAVIIGDQYVKPEYWHRIRPKPGAFVAVRATPGAKDNSLLRNILLLAVSAAALLVPVFGPGLSALAVGLISAGITIGGTLLINALFPIRPPVLEDANKKQTYSISGGSNQADPHGPVPFHLGVNRYYPKRGAQDKVIFIGDDQYLTMLLIWGYARITLENIKIGETPITDFDDVDIEHDQFFESGSETLTLYHRQVLQEDLAIELNEAAGYQSRTTPADIDEIIVNVTAPNGIFRFHKATNERLKYPIKFRAHYRLVGTSAWQLLGIMDLTSRSDETIRVGARKKVPTGQYEVRVGKTSSDYSGTDEVQEALFWSKLTTARNDPPLSFDSPLTVTAIRIKATGQLNGVVDSVNAVCTARGWTYNGTSWSSNGTDSNPASLFRQVLQGPFNARPVVTGKIDLTTLEVFWHYCDDNGFTFNMVRDFRASVWETISDICGAARARPFFKDGKWSVIWEEADAPIAGHFGTRNSRGFVGQRSYARTPHGWRVAFINADMGWQRDERIVYDDGYSASNATLFEGIEFPGVTDPDLIWKLGRYHIAQARLRPETYSLTVDREALKNTIGDLVRVQHDLPLFGLTSGRVKFVDGQAITIDEPVTMVVGTSYGVRFQTDAGTSLLRNVTTNDGVNLVINLSGSGDVPEPGNLFLFGVRGEESVNLRIQKIKYNDEAAAVLTLVDDAPEIMEADQGVIPQFDSQITVPPDAATMAPVDLRFREQVTAQAGKIETAVLFSWDTVAGNAAIAFQVSHKDDDGDNIWRNDGRVEADQKFMVIRRLSRGPWSFRVRALFEDGTSSKWATLPGRTVTGEARVPDDVTNFQVDPVGDRAALSWDRVLTAGLSHYVIRYSTLLTGATWASSTLLLDNIVATRVEVPARSGTYLIRAVTQAGIESTNATLISTNVAGLVDLNVDEVYQAETAWTGTKTNVEVNAGTLRLIATGTIADWPPIDELTSDHWTTQFPFAFGSFVPTTPAYLDLGEKLTSRVKNIVDAAGENINNLIGAWGLIGDVGLIGGANADRWVVKAYESHTDDNPAGTPTWTDYRELTAPVDISFRAIRFKLELYSLDPYVRPVVTSWKVNIDMPDRVEAEQNLVSNAGSVLVVTFPNGAFRFVKGIGIAAQNMATGDYYTMTSKTDAGFSIRFFNAAGTGIQRTFDYVSKGYGRVL